jgi:hypothetical protein
MKYCFKKEKACCKEVCPYTYNKICQYIQYIPDNSFKAKELKKTMPTFTIKDEDVPANQIKLTS